ncbi:THO complex subunit 2 [Mortierella sp. GBA35]|nr:THO complex subunit 2 [Mortierella sp. GBA35]
MNNQGSWCICHPELVQGTSISYRHPTVPEGSELTIVRLLSPEFPPSTSTQRFEFFYTEWTDVAEIVRTLLELVSLQIHRHPTVVAKLCHIGTGTLDRPRNEFKSIKIKKSLTKPRDGGTSTEETILNGLRSAMILMETAWIEMVHAFFSLPAVSLSYSNADMVEEVWQLMRGMSSEARYDLYKEWKSKFARLYPGLLDSTTEAEKDA